MKYKEQQKARQLRQNGFSIGHIALELSVSKGSVSRWVRDVPLTDAQKQHLINANPVLNKQFKGASVRKQNARELRKSYQQNGISEAKKDNILHMAGCMLYWAEGAKSRYSLSIINSDKFLLRLFIYQ